MWFVFACSDFALHSTEKHQQQSPSIVVSPSAYNYGEQVPQSSSSETFTIKNHGNAALQINDISLEGSDAFSFFFPEEAQDLLPGTEKNFEIIFSASGNLEEGFLRIESNDPAQPVVHVPIHGASPSAAILLAPNPLDFGYVPVHNQSEDIVYIQNIGALDGEIQNIYLQESAFSIAPIALPISLPVGSILELPVTFSPETEGRFEEALWVESDIGAHMVSIQGSSEEGTIEEDPCFDPDLSYNQHPEAKLRVRSALTPVFATYLYTGAGYTNELWLQSPHLIHIATGHETPEDTIVPLGNLSADQELFFKMYVRDTGYHYYSGPAHRNPDNRIHAAISYLGDCAWMVGFEDMYNGGDQDFDDILMVLSGDLQMLP